MGRPRKKLDENQRSQNRFIYNRSRQRGQGVEWNITWLEWHNFYLSHGIDKNTHKQPNDNNTLCLYRKNTSLPVQLDNIFLANKAHGMKGVIKPKAWLHKDPNIHRKYLPFLRMRSQAAHRQEPWSLLFEEFCHLWPDELWDMRGRATNDLCMSREDPEGPWDRKNTIILPRHEQLRRAQFRRNSLK